MDGLGDAVVVVTDSVDEVVNPVDEVVNPVDEVVNPVDGLGEAVVVVTDSVDEVRNPVDEVVNPVDEVVNPVDEVVNPVDEVLNPMDEVVNPVDGLSDAERSSSALYAATSRPARASRSTPARAVDHCRVSASDGAPITLTASSSGNVDAGALGLRERSAVGRIVEHPTWAWRSTCRTPSGERSTRASTTSFIAASGSVCSVISAQRTSAARPRSTS